MSEYIKSADLAENLMKENEELRRELEVCRNELCLRCGDYKERHLGACKGCRWHVEPEEDKA